MSLTPEITSRISDSISSATRIVCLCHANPDGDAVGSLIGMGLLLEMNYPEKEIVLLCRDSAPDVFSFMPGQARIVHATNISSSDLVIFLDCAVPKQTSFEEEYPQLFDGSVPSICLDHHPSNSNFAGFNVVETAAASTCEIVLDLAEKLNWKFDSDIATCLLTGVYTDTGGLLHSNTTASVYRTVAGLLRRGARQQEIVKHVFRTAKLSTLKLWGRVLEKITTTEEGGAVSAVTQGDFRATGAHYSELTGAIDYVNAIPGMRFSLILSEREGVVKGSIRTLRDDVDVSEMASTFQGGGHTKAAGFSIPGKLKPEVRWKVVDEGQGQG